MTTLGEPLRKKKRTGVSALYPRAHAECISFPSLAPMFLAVSLRRICHLTGISIGYLEHDGRTQRFNGSASVSVGTKLECACYSVHAKHFLPSCFFPAFHHFLLPLSRIPSFILRNSGDHKKMSACSPGSLWISLLAKLLRGSQCVTLACILCISSTLAARPRVSHCASGAVISAESWLVRLGAAHGSVLSSTLPRSSSGCN